MWFLSARNARRTSSASAKRGAFRPRLETLEDRCLLSNLDPFFGTNGVVTGPIAEANAVVVQADGKIVAGGSNKSGSISEFALARYLPNGLLDSSVNDPSSPFGANGSGVVQSVVGVNNSVINGIALQSNGDIVAVGQAVVKSKGHYDPVFAIARYLPNGMPDTTFGMGGIATTIVETGQFTSGTVGAFAVAIPSDGSGNIYVAGTASPNISSDNAAGDEFALARYTSKGVLDTSFNYSGKVPGLVETPQFGPMNTSQEDLAAALTIQPSNGYIVVVGTTGDSVTGLDSDPATFAMAVVRYTSSGGLDQNFNATKINSGIAGIVTGLAGPTNSNGNSARGHGVLVESGAGDSGNMGDIVVAGNYWFDVTLPLPTSNEDQILVRLTPLGILDTTFGGVGNPNPGYVINTQLYGALALAQDANGNLLAASATTLATSTPNEIGVAAFNSDGTPDTSYWGTGSDTTNIPTDGSYFSGGDSYGTAMAIDGNGNIVVGGYAYPTSGGPATIALARFVP